jgi:hypothetical protein
MSTFQGYCKLYSTLLGGVKALGGVRENNIPDRREEWELENQRLAP